MTLRQDHLLAHMDAYAVDKSDNALLLKYVGIATASKLAKSKLLSIDPVTKALLVRWIDAVPGLTGEQIVSLLEALASGSRLSHAKLDDIVSGSHHVKTVSGDISLNNLAEKNHASLANVTPAQHHVKTVSGDINLNDLAEKNHISLANVTSAQHHARYTDAEAIAAVGEIEGANALTYLGL